MLTVSLGICPWYLPKSIVLIYHPTSAYDSGQTHLLLQLHGTIPISYRSQTYHIPIVVWFPLEYPRRPPIAYVNPTKDMLIRKSKEVEPSGKVGGEMVEMWERKWEVSLGLMGMGVSQSFKVFQESRLRLTRSW
jgi:hypothetical protein